MYIPRNFCPRYYIVQKFEKALISPHKILVLILHISKKYVIGKYINQLFFIIIFWMNIPRNFFLGMQLACSCRMSLSLHGEERVPKTGYVQIFMTLV